jgi:hypothetical protein
VRAYAGGECARKVDMERCLCGVVTRALPRTYRTSRISWRRLPVRASHILVECTALKRKKRVGTPQ